MHVTNNSKGSLSFSIGHEAVTLEPGEKSRELSDAEAVSFRAHPVHLAWLLGGLLVASDSLPDAEGTKPAPEPKPAKKGRTSVKEVKPDAPVEIQTDIED